MPGIRSLERKSYSRQGIPRHAVARTGLLELHQVMTLSADQSVSILWRRIDRPGHESAFLFQREGNWYLNGVAVFLHEGKPCCLNYRIVCNFEWHTHFVEVTGWVGHSQVQVQAKVEPAGVWDVNGAV